MNWDEVKEAVELVRRRRVKRVDGDGWKVYLAGSVVRVDFEPVKVNEQQMPLPMKGQA